jgi:pyrimidine operon attenuation protein / uracil phosphoribosyltransferase
LLLASCFSRKRNDIIAPFLKRFAPRKPKKMKKNKSKLLMAAAEIDLVLARISAEIVEKLSPQDEFAIVGIRRRGVHLAQRLCQKVGTILKRPIPLGILDITLYRDDLTTVSNRPMLRETLIDFDINDLSLVLVDDVLYTGRTIRAALDGIVDLGRPKKVQLAVLIDRGGRELPIQADYVGKHVETAEDETVEVRLNEEDQEERVILLKMSTHDDTDD